jgi:type I restriction enzyme R subunit
MKFTEAQLEAAIIQLLGEVGYPHVLGESINRQPDEVLIKDDLRAFLAARYAADNITPGEIETVIRKLAAYSAADLYESNKAIMKLVADGFLLKREDRNQKDLYVQLIDYSSLTWDRLPACHPSSVSQDHDRLEAYPTLVAESSGKYTTDHNIFKLVNQLEIHGSEKRIPDGILYIKASFVNKLPNWH